MLNGTRSVATNRISRSGPPNATEHTASAGISILLITLDVLKYSNRFAWNVYLEMIVLTFETITLDQFSELRLQNMRPHIKNHLCQESVRVEQSHHHQNYQNDVQYDHFLYEI